MRLRPRRRKRLLFLDLDGVLAPFGGAEAYSTLPLSEAALHNGAVRYRGDTVRALRGLLHFNLEICWLTSWGEEGNAALGKVFGKCLPFTEVGDSPAWKWERVETALADGHRVVWVDDEAFKLAPSLEPAALPPNLFVVSPDSGVGLSPTAVAEIRAWLLAK